MEEHSLGQKLAAEFIGTALLVFVGAGSVPAMILLTSDASPFSGAEVGMVALAFGLIVTAMVYSIGKVSGCHINPAVTFALAATKRFPWSGVPAYWTAQVAGAIAGALAIWASFGSRVFDFGAGFGVVDFNHDVTSWGSAMFVEASGRRSCCSRSSASSTRARPRAGPGSSSASPSSRSSSPSAQSRTPRSTRPAGSGRCSSRT